MLDLYRLDEVFTDYTGIRRELELFSDVLLEKEEIIVLSKADLLDSEMKEHIVSEFKKEYSDKTIFVCNGNAYRWYAIQSKMSQAWTDCPYDGLW